MLDFIGSILGYITSGFSGLIELGISLINFFGVATTIFYHFPTDLQVMLLAIVAPLTAIVFAKMYQLFKPI